MGQTKHRWVLEEPNIPFDCPILFENDRILVVDKPHFLATMPRGMWYRSTVVIRLREQLNNPDITPAHRLDRNTAGVLLLVKDKAYRGVYQKLFEQRNVHKMYECLAPCRPLTVPRYGTVTHTSSTQPFPLVRRSHIVKERGVLRAYETAKQPNAESYIDRKEAVWVPSSHKQSRILEPICRYELTPVSGKTHQLRLHMASLGIPILGENWYPQVREWEYDDFSSPLQLVARRLSFDDPIDHTHYEFVSREPLCVISRPQVEAKE